MDATHFYFADGSKVLKFPLTGSSQASLLVQEQEPSGHIVQIEEIELTRNRVAYIVSDKSSTQQTQSLKMIGKNGGLLQTITTQPANDFLAILITSDNFVYYQQGLTTSAALAEDGSQKVVDSAFWTGYTYTPSFFVGRVVRVDGCTVSSCAGGTLKSVDADTNSGDIILGNLPSTLANPPFFFGIGSDSLGAAIAGQGTSDIFYVKPGQANSLIRVTDTPVTSELPIF
jgi:hypothetical protein